MDSCRFVVTTRRSLWKIKVYWPKCDLKIAKLNFSILSTPFYRINFSYNVECNNRIIDRVETLKQNVDCPFSVPRSLGMGKWKILIKYCTYEMAISSLVIFLFFFCSCRFFDSAEHESANYAGADAPKCILRIFVLLVYPVEEKK